MAVLRQYTVTLQDMRTLAERRVLMFGVTAQAAAEGARGRQDCPAAFAVLRVAEG